MDPARPMMGWPPSSLAAQITSMSMDVPSTTSVPSAPVHIVEVGDERSFSRPGVRLDFARGNAGSMPGSFELDVGQRVSRSRGGGGLRESARMCSVASKTAATSVSLPSL
jgi:hypothetical protein